ncbi:MAG: hypothetical protein ACREQD_05450 [Candidatus Binataceae bacterium]
MRDRPADRWELVEHVPRGAPGNPVQDLVALRKPGSQAPAATLRADRQTAPVRAACLFATGEPVFSFEFSSCAQRQWEPCTIRVGREAVRQLPPLATRRGPIKRRIHPAAQIG